MTLQGCDCSRVAVLSTAGALHDRNGTVEAMEIRCADCGCTVDIQKIVTRGTLASGAPLLMPDLTESQVSVGYTEVDNAGNNYRGAPKIYTVTVSAYIPYAGFGFLGYLQMSPPTLAASHQERVVGVR